MSNLVFKTNFLKGEAGNSIASIDKTGSDEEKDTYTITLTDGSTTSFEVEKGKDLNVLNLAHEESVTASRAYDVGDHLIYNDLYYYVITAIAQGDTLEEGVNIERKRVGEEIEEINNNLSQLMSLIYPVGAIYMSVNNTNPSSLFGGTWVPWGSGQVPVGIDTSDTDFDTVEKTGGSKTHTLTVEEMPSHKHKYTEYHLASGVVSSGGYSVSTESTRSDGDFDYYTTEVGGDQPHSILQPYITCYMWKRVS